MNILLLVGLMGFIFVNLALGLYKGRGVKTMKDYALANRAMGTGTLMMTIIATIIGAPWLTVGFISTQQKGIIDPIFITLSYTIGALFLGRVVFPKLLRFKHCYTLGDIMGQHYGPKAQLFTGIMSIFICLLIIASQLVALENIATMLGIPLWVTIGIVGLAVMCYTFTGGMRAVAATDVLQFILVMGGFAFIAYQVLDLEVTIAKYGPKEKIDSIGDFMKKIQRKVLLLGKESQHLSIGSHKRFSGILIGFMQFSIIFFSPAIINRVLAARSRPQVRQAFTGFAVFYPLVSLSLTCIGFGLLLSYGEGKIPEHGVFNVVTNYLFKNSSMSTTAVELMLMLMLLGAVMSTADSYLNALVVVVVRDILQYKQSKKEPDTEKLKHIKTITLAAGIMSIVFAYFFYYFGAYSSSVYQAARDIFGCFVVVVIAAAFKFKGNHKTFFYTVGLFLGLFTIVGILFQSHIWVIGKEEDWANLYFRRKMRFGVVPILLLTAIVFPLIHIMVYGRLTWEKSKVKGEAVCQMGGIKKKWRTIFFHPLAWAKDTFARYGNEPTAVGFFLALSSVVRVTISPHFHGGHTMIFALLNLLGVLLCALLMIHVMWRQPFKHYFPLFYYGALIYILPFMHMLLFLYQPMSILLMIQLAMSIVLLHLLVDWRSYFFFTIIGWGIAGIVYWVTYLTPEASASEFLTLNRYDLIWLGFVTLTTSLGIGFLFCSRQEQLNTQRLMRTKTYAAGFGHDLLNLYQCPQSTIDYVQHVYKQGKKDTINEAEEWDNMARYMQECAAQAHAFKKLIKFDYIPQSEIKLISIKALMEKAHGLIPSLLRDRVHIEASQDFKVAVFPPFVNNIILNLVKNAQKHGNAEEVVLSWDVATRRLYIKDNGSGIPSHIASKIGDLYATSSQNGTGNGIGLAFVFMVVEDIFKAQINFTTSDKGTTFWIEFPPVKRS